MVEEEKKGQLSVLRQRDRAVMPVWQDRGRRGEGKSGLDGERFACASEKRLRIELGQSDGDVGVVDGRFPKLVSDDLEQRWDAVSLGAVACLGHDLFHQLKYLQGVRIDHRVTQWG